MDLGHTNKDDEDEGDETVEYGTEGNVDGATEGNEMEEMMAGSRDNDEDSIGAVVWASDLMEADDWNALQEKYRNIAHRNAYDQSQLTSTPCPVSTLGEGTVLRDLVAKDITLGLCIQVLHQPSVEKKLVDAELSMLRLIEFCNLLKNSHKFLDGLLDLVAEAMEVRGFDPRRRPSREYVSSKVMKLYGGGCAPETRHMVAANNEDKVLTAQEKAEAAENVGGFEVSEEVDFVNLLKEQVE
jgi:hypothetical protein